MRTYTEILHRDHVWRRCCRASSTPSANQDGYEAGVIRGKHDARSKRAANEEEEESVVYGLVCRFDVGAWMFRFSGHQRHIFRTDYTERCGP